MGAEWVLAKYMPDPRRREPINVGVIVRVGDQVETRFIGQRADGSIDGKRVWGRVQDLRNYKAWVDYWQRTAPSVGDLDAMLSRRSRDPSYFLEFGGEVLLSAGPTTAEEEVERLFAELVEEVALESWSVERLADAVVRRLPVTVETGVELNVGRVDHLFFDYGYTNGLPNLMQRVSIPGADKASWKAIHAAAWSFREVKRLKNYEQSQTIALVKIGDGPDTESGPVAKLRELAILVPVNDVSEATRQLSELLHVEDGHGRPEET